KPGCGRSAHSTGCRSGCGRDLPASLGLRSVSGQAQGSQARALQPHCFPAKHGAASKGRGPSGAAKEPEAPAGEAPPRAHQREPEPAQGAHPAAPGQGGECRGARIPAGRAGAEGGGALWHRARRLGGQRCSCQGPRRGLQAAPKAEPRLGGADRPNAGHCAGGTQLLARAGCSWQPAGGLSVLIVGGVQSSHYSKLEKADILEMTVRFLQELPASSCPTAAPSESPHPTPAPARPCAPCPALCLAPHARSLPAASSDSYREGYRACLARLARVLPACRVLEPALSARLLEHLRRRAACATPDSGRAGDPSGPPAPSPPPAPAPSPPVPPRGPSLWRPW
uniref:Hes family bHLH transcription factor 2 n=1 Tax=Sus scrofa TaxID=9823 RepID=A0A4X1W8V9_PIG